MTARSVLITGCSSGIGHATAERLLSSGHRVYATARRPDSVSDLAERGATTLPLDVTDEGGIEAAVKAVSEAEGAVDVLVNNAGYGLQGPAEEIPMDEVRRQFETNVFGLVRLCQLVLPRMRERRWGRIVNLSSMGGKLTIPGGAYYHASKYAVEAFSDALRYEVKPFGVRVVIVEPGPVATRFGDTATSTLSTSSNGGGPYASFTSGLEKRIQDAFEGSLSVFASKPQAVARTIERAISSRSPRPRYRVGVASRALLSTRKVLPDRAWDLFVRTQMPRPTGS